MPVVADAKIHSAGAAPVAKEHREGTPAGSERGCRCVGRIARGRPEELVVEAELVRIGAGGIDVVPEGKRRQRRAGLPRRAERHRGGGRRAETPSLVRALETAAAEAAKEDVLAIPEHHEVGDPIAVDVDGIGAVHGCEVRDWIAQPGETKGAPDGTVIPIERR